MKKLLPFTLALTTFALMSCDSQDPLAERTQRLEQAEQQLADKKAALADKQHQFEQGRITHSTHKENTLNIQQSRQEQLDQQAEALDLRVSAISKEDFKLGAKRRTLVADQLNLEKSLRQLELEGKRVASRERLASSEIANAKKAQQVALDDQDTARRASKDAYKKHNEALALIKSQKQLAMNYKHLSTGYTKLKNNHDGLATSHMLLVRKNAQLDRDYHNLECQLRDFNDLKNKHVQLTRSYAALKHQSQDAGKLSRDLVSAQKSRDLYARELKTAQGNNEAMKKELDRQKKFNKALLGKLKEAHERR